MTIDFNKQTVKKQAKNDIVDIENHNDDASLTHTHTHIEWCPIVITHERMEDNKLK